MSEEIQLCPECNRLDGKHSMACSKRPYVTCSYCGKHLPIYFSGLATSAIHRDNCEAYKQAQTHD